MTEHRGLRRRDFLLAAGGTVAALTVLPACSSDGPDDSTPGTATGPTGSDGPSDFDDLLSCWFSVPRAVEVDGRTWAGGVTPAVVEPDRYDDPLAALTPDEPGGGVYVVEDGVDERHLLMTTAADDHNNPSFLIHPDKPPVVFVTEHNAKDVVSYRVGTTPLDLSTLGPVREISFEGVGSHVSYSQTWARPGTDRVVCLSRLTPPSDNPFATPRFWAVAVSEDWCETWATPHRLVDFGDQGYLLSHLDGDVLHMAATVHPDRDHGQSISYLAFDLATGAVIDAAGEILGDFLTGDGLPLAHGPSDGSTGTAGGGGSTMLVSAVDEPRRTWVEAVGVGPSIVWSEWDEAVDPRGGDYRHARWDGSAWAVTTIVPSGGIFPNTDTIGDIAPQPYRGGASIDADGHVWLSRHDGDTWAIERWTDDGGTWELVETIASSTEHRLVRPYCPEGRTSGPRVLWHELSEYTSPSLYISTLHFEPT